MNRGDIVLIREPRTPAAKARPCVIIQRDSTIDHANKITVCPLTSDPRDGTGTRPFIHPTPENRLKAPSQVEIDWVFTHPLAFVGPRVGKLDDDAMDRVDAALRRWLDL